MSSEYLNHTKATALKDVDSLIKAESEYGDSWKKRGGVGAFMMLARKWDRIENRCRREPGGGPLYPTGDRWDIFDHIANDKRAEGLIDDIRDLRRYLLLVEAEMIARGHAREEVKKGEV